MHFKEYDDFVEKTALNIVKNNPSYYVLGLCGEAGEVAEKVKKILRDKEGVVDGETKDALLKELGDVLWYVARTSQVYGASLAEVAEKNIKKLSDRVARGVSHGDGDNR